jgi:RNA polymerase sigma-70 factor (ECF subfamily)
MARRARRERTVVADADAIALSFVADSGEVLELRDEIERALAALSPEQREAFLLRHVEGLSYEEMVEATGAGVSALKMRVKRASERLKVLLDEGAKVDDRP